MPKNPPLTASGSRELKRPRSISKHVREAIKLMVYGRLDDPDCRPIDFIEAAKIVGLQPDQMRRHLDRADVRALLLGERRAFRAAVCASNELALRRVRDTSPNGMAVIGSVRALEQLEEADAPARINQATTPGLVIQIVAAAQAAPQPITVNARPAVTIDHEGPRHDANGNPIFDPRTWPRY